MPNDLNANQENTRYTMDRELLEQFVSNSDTEVMEEELNSILEDELGKHESEIDLQMVDELLEILEPIEIDEGTIEAGRKKLSASLRSGKKPHSRVFIYFRRAAAAMAAIVVLFFVSLGSARAMRWTFLLKYLEPIAQTFGIFAGEHAEQSVPLSSYASADGDNKQISYSSVEDVPNTYDGYRIRLNNVPDRFSQITGSFSDEPETKMFNLFYQNENEWMSYLVYIFVNEDSAIMYEYEMTANEAENRLIGTKNVTFYHTAEDETLSVSWVDRNAHYSIVGYISEDELADILLDMD